MGSVLASVVGVAIAWSWSGARLKQGTLPARRLVLFGLPLTGIMLLRRTVQNMDLWAITRLLTGYDRAAYYGLAQYISRAILMLPVAVSGAVFPTLTLALERGDQSACRQLVEQSFRFALVITVAALAVLGGSMHELIVLIFGAKFGPATTVTVYLLVAAVLFAMEFIGNQLLVAADKPGLCLAAFAPVVPVNIVLNYFLVSRYDMLGGALTTIITAALLAAVMIVLVWREFRTIISPLTVLRTLLAGAVIYVIGINVPTAGWPVLLKCGGLALLYGLVLMAEGELRKSDLAPLALWRTQ